MSEGLLTKVLILATSRAAVWGAEREVKLYFFQYFLCCLHFFTMKNIFLYI